MKKLNKSNANSVVSLSRRQHQIENRILGPEDKVDVLKHVDKNKEKN
jgi:hypothetical protein